MAKPKLEIEVVPKFTITDDTAQACANLLSLYLEGRPDKTIRVTKEPGGDAYQRKVRIVPEREEEEEGKVPCMSCEYLVKRRSDIYCNNTRSEYYSKSYREGMGCEKGYRRDEY